MRARGTARVSPRFCVSRSRRRRCVTAVARDTGTGGVSWPRCGAGGVFGMPRALITGITGQDGSYLSEHLLKKGYDVYGLIRGQANPKRAVLERTLPDVRLVEGDLLDQASLLDIVQRTKPDEVYN